MAICFLADDLLKGTKHKEHGKRGFTDGEVVGPVPVPALYFRGNQAMALYYVGGHIFSGVTGKSGFTERLHRLREILMFILLRIDRCAARWNGLSIPFP